MGILKMKEEILDKKTSIIKNVLFYFSSKEDNFSNDKIEQIAAAADHAYTDNILFEEFENWVKEKDDDTFLHLIDHYWTTKDKPVLSDSEKNLTGKDSRIEKIKNAAKQEQASAFASLLNDLATKRGLKTLEDIGNFLGFSTERARVLLEGKHKPQRKTIIKVAEKFEMNVNEIFQRILN